MAKLTTAAAVCFMLTSLGLAYVSSASRMGNVQLPASQQIPAQIPAETLPAAEPETSPEAAPDNSQAPEGDVSVPQAAGEETGAQDQ
jgi:preprotein translocase subunit SecG